MILNGKMLIGASAVRGNAGSQLAFNPTTNADIPEPVFHLGGREEVQRAAQLASDAFDQYRHMPLSRRAAFLESIADNIMAIGDILMERAHAETGLPVARLQGERGRTVGQLRLFAQVVRDGHFLTATIDTAQPDRQPLPRADLRLAKIPLGPVAVFGASNFPLAFSVAGGDTASAFAAGAPVIVKAHSAHLGTSELVGRAIQKAVREHDLPEGVFSLLFGRGREAGEQLVAHPLIKAVGFTGSRQGGLALMNIANNRPEPIPVYAEMSSINPVFIMPTALNQRGADIARGLVDSLTLGAGQFCTNPGLVLAIDSPALEPFMRSLTEAVNEKQVQTMLTAPIHEAYAAGNARVQTADGVQTVGLGQDANGKPNAARAAVYATDASRFLKNPDLHAEMFGPATIIVRARDMDELMRVAQALEGQLTATLHIEPADYAAAGRLMPMLERKAGRILVNGFPTGVEVCHAMVHGGPFPASSNAMFTSVGATAIDRFLRPVCYQDMPDELLPEALKQTNSTGIYRMLDGALSKN